MFYIYKITNKINNKVYIGLTTLTINKRWNGHKRIAKKSNKPLYCAMRKYGLENFIIEKVDETDDIVKLGELERENIKYYNSTDPKYGYNLTHGGESNQLDANPRARLTVDDVKKIRNIYLKGEIGISECWDKMYKNKISFSAFEKVWEGTTWTSVMPEVYTDENKQKQLSFKRNFGDKNGNAILSDDEIIIIRKYYVNHTLKECYEKFGSKFKSIVSFRNVIDKSYPNIPKYSKILKEWVKK